MLYHRIYVLQELKVLSSVKKRDGVKGVGCLWTCLQSGFVCPLGSVCVSARCSILCIFHHVFSRAAWGRTAAVEGFDREAVCMWPVLLPFIERLLAGQLQCIFAQVLSVFVCFVIRI